MRSCTIVLPLWLCNEMNIIQPWIYQEEGRPLAEKWNLSNLHTACLTDVEKAKLSHLKETLKPRAIDTFGNGSSLSHCIRDSLFQIQKDIQVCSDNSVLANLFFQELSLNIQLAKALMEGNKVAKQKAKVQWSIPKTLLFSIILL